MPRNYNIEGTNVARPIHLGVFTRDPKSGAERSHRDGDVATIVVTEDLIELGPWSFGVVTLQSFQINYMGKLAKAADNIGLSEPVAAKGGHKLRTQIEKAVDRIVDMMLEQHPYLSLLVGPNDEPERAVPIEAMLQGHDFLTQASAPVTVQQRSATVHADLSVLEGVNLPPDVQQRLRNAAAASAAAQQIKAAAAAPAAPAGVAAEAPQAMFPAARPAVPPPASPLQGLPPGIAAALKG